MTIRDSLSSELAAALRRRDTMVIAILRSALACLDNAQAPPVPDEPSASTAGSVYFAGAAAGLGAAEVRRIPHTEAEQRTLLDHEMADLCGHIERLDRLCRRDEADAARRALTILEGVRDTSP